MLCQHLIMVVAHNHTHAIAQGDDGDLILIWDSTMIYFTSESLLALADVIDQVSRDPQASICTSTFQWHPAPDDAALVWMGRTCFYLPSNERSIFCNLISNGAHHLRNISSLAQQSVSPFSPVFCQLTVSQADEITLN